jgi:site-specific DNA recombinase
MRAAIYARYSSDMQSEASIEDQVRLCRERIESRDWDLVQTYADRATSGASILRPGLQGLIEDVMSGKLDVVVAEALDRLSRDQADIAALYKRFSFAGVQIVTLAEGEVTELHVGLKGTMNQLFLKDLADKTRRGLRGRVEAGKSGGGRCYGYRVGDEIGDREINPAEAEIVRRVFEDYAAGLSPRAIAKSLNHEGIPSPSGKPWGASTIHGNPKRGTGLLNNELYVGRLVWNRLRYMKDPETGKRVSRLNPESKWIVKQVPNLRIMDDALWTAVKSRQKAAALGPQSETGMWSRKRPKHLLTGLVRCGACGGGYIQVGKDYLGCAAHRNKGTCSNKKTVRRDRLEAAVLDGLKNHLVDPDLVKSFCDEFVAETNRIRRVQASSADTQRRELAGLESGIRNILEAVKSGMCNASLKEELDALEIRKVKLEGELRSLEVDASAPPILHPALADVYRHKVDLLNEALLKEETRIGAIDILRSLIEQITVVLAGVGFEPTTFRL